MKTDWEMELGRHGVDILFQREAHGSDDVNTGFFICRSTPAVQSFWREVGTLLDAHPDWNEQRCVNELLTGSGGNVKAPAWGWLPWTFYARTHGWPPPPDAWIYHANYTKGADGVGQKMRQMDLARRYFEAGAVEKILIHFRIMAMRGPSGLFQAIWRRLMR